MEVGAPPGERQLEQYRRELTGYCYRMLGSGAEAEDAVQETMLRAWRAADRFEGRSSVRSWLYRIATNVCIDMGRQPQRRARPMEMGPPSNDQSQGTSRLGLAAPAARLRLLLPTPSLHSHHKSHRASRWRRPV